MKAEVGGGGRSVVRRSAGMSLCRPLPVRRVKLTRPQLWRTTLPLGNRSCCAQFSFRSWELSGQISPTPDTLSLAYPLSD